VGVTGLIFHWSATSQQYSGCIVMQSILVSRYTWSFSHTHKLFCLFWM
jgi:hypothetical protein